LRKMTEYGASLVAVVFRMGYKAEIARRIIFVVVDTVDFEFPFRKSVGIQQVKPCFFYARKHKFYSPATVISVSRIVWILASLFCRCQPPVQPRGNHTWL